MNGFPSRRLRRLRYNPTLREMLAGVRLSRSELIAPLFVGPGRSVRREISAMPGQFQFSVDQALTAVKRWSDLGLKSVLLFGLPNKKDEVGCDAYNPAAPLQQLLAKIKHALPEMFVITDVCLCEYTSTGHCGVTAKRKGRSRPGRAIACTRSMGVSPMSPTGVPPVVSVKYEQTAHGQDGRVTHGRDARATCSRSGRSAGADTDIDNDATLELLARTAISHAQAGADMVAPSAMMDGQVGAIRSALDQGGFANTPIMSYAIKFFSSLYGPFRQAAQSTPQFGDRRSYQMDPLSPHQAHLEAKLDVEEGADILMVKPAATYLDVIAAIRKNFDLPLAAYHVSGEYSMIKAAAANGWIDEKAVVIEVTSAIKRAGADLIITYFAEALATWI